MANEIISYIEMCQREGGVHLQKGMNFELARDHSVLLMSVRSGSPYQDRLEEDGSVLVYEGHDEPKTVEIMYPKLIDQPEFSSSGLPTQNGKFHYAAQKTKKNQRPAERVRVYEKIRKGIWSYNGVFHLIDSWTESDERRKVFKFKLLAVVNEEFSIRKTKREVARRRVIPSPVKLEVWERDGGKCVQCGATNELHFDHDLPYSKGGSSLIAENVQLLCARHNLSKSDRIE